jgi:DNA-binding NarL/FixJ family response regulator
MPVAVAVFTDQPVLQRGLASVLNHSDFRLTFAATRRAAQASILPDAVALLHLDARRGDPLKHLEAWTMGGAKHSTVVWSAFDSPGTLARSVALKASNLVLTDEPVDRLAQAIRDAAVRQPARADSVFAAMQLYLAEVPSVRRFPAGLTSRESQVWRHLGLGLSNREIALSLDVTVETVKEYVQNLLRKLNANDRTHAAVMAIRSDVAAWNPGT